MTLIIGIMCKDGAVMGADGAATFGALGDETVRLPVKRKLYLLNNQTVVGSSGPKGIGQRFAGEIELIQRDGVPVDGGQRIPLATLPPHKVMEFLRRVLWAIIKPELEIAATMSHALKRPDPFQSALTHSLVCLPVGGDICLLHFDQHGAPEQVTHDLPFVAIGSGQRIADPFLAFVQRIYWPKEAPTVDQGILAAVWALDHAIKTHPGGVGEPIQVVTVRRTAGSDWQASEMAEAVWQEHLQFIMAIEDEMASLPRKLQQDAPSIPPPPPNPSVGRSV